MLSKIIFLFLGFTVGILSVGNAQDLNKDSLKSLLRNETDDSLKVIHLTDISWEYCYSNTDSALIYAEMAIEIANDRDDLLSKTKAFSMRANVYYFKSDLDLAIADYIQALNMDEELGDSLAIAVQAADEGWK